MTQSVTNSLNNLEQMLSGSARNMQEATKSLCGMDKTSRNFETLLKDATGEKNNISSKLTVDVTKKEEITPELISNSSEKRVIYATLEDVKSSENKLDTEGENWTEFRDMLNQITEEANVETSLDLTLAKDINEIISQLKEAIENATEIAESTSEEEAENIEDIAGALLSVLQNNENNALNSEQNIESALKDVPFEQVLTFVDETKNSVQESIKTVLEEDLATALEDVEISQEEIIEFAENMTDEAVADKVAKDVANSESESLLDEELLKDLKIESIKAETEASGGETLMQNQTPEEHSVRLMINNDIEAFDLKLEAVNNTQTAQNNSQVKTMDINPSRIIDQITKHLEALQNNSKVNIVLNPESLGKVNIQLLSTKEGLAAQFTVTTQEARDLLMKGLDGLKESLASHGVGVDNVSVKVADSQKSEYKQDWTEQEGSRGGNKEQEQPNREEKEKGLFEKMMAQSANEENGNV